MTRVIHLKEEEGEGERGEGRSGGGKTGEGEGTWIQHTLAHFLQPKNKAQVQCI